MERQYIKSKTVQLNNNCPECYSNEGLELSFEQEFIESKFYTSITNNTRQNLNCTNCNTIIYPVRWTDNIDRIVDYHNKSFHPQPKSFKLKWISWIILVVIDIIILLIILYVTGVFN